MTAPVSNPVDLAAMPDKSLRLQQSADAMGSTFSIVLYGYDRVKMEAAVEAAFVFSYYRPMDGVPPDRSIAGFGDCTKDIGQ
jgi:hypothetical protein